MNLKSIRALVYYIFTTQNSRLIAQATSEFQKLVKCKIDLSDCNLTFTKFCILDKRNGTHLGCQCNIEKFENYDFDEYCDIKQTTGTEPAVRTSRSLKIEKTATLQTDSIRTFAVDPVEENSTKITANTTMATSQKTPNISSTTDQVLGARFFLENSSISEQFFCIGLQDSVDKYHQLNDQPFWLDPADILRCSLIYSVLLMIFIGLVLSGCCVYSMLVKTNAEGAVKQVYSIGRVR